MQCTVKRHFDLNVYYHVRHDVARKLLQLILSNYLPQDI